MKPILLFFALCWATVSATAQPVPTPAAPTQLTFADLQVRFDDEARLLVQQDINALMANRQYWNSQLERAVLYFPLIEAVLLSNGVPADVKYLAMQESALLPDAVSSSQAVGFWQFKLETAQNYGLAVTEEVDERKNISASSRATAKYLLRSYGIYTNWVSALYSFYLGAGGISKLVSPAWAGASSIDLNGSTDRYVLRFFAHKIAVESALATYKPNSTFALVEYGEGAGKTIQTIADELNVSAADIRAYNRWLLVDHVPTDKPYLLTIPTPYDRLNSPLAKTTNVPGPPAATALANDDLGFPVLKRVTQYAGSVNDPILYEINGLPGIQAQPGDRPATLARKARISLSSFLRYNDLSDRDAVVPGEVYYLAKKRKKALVPFHTARPDELMRGISQRYGIRLKKLLRYNRMDRVQKLQVGRVLWLRERRPAKKPVEILTAPPAYGPPPTELPITRPTESVAVETGAGQTGGIPRNASERRRYQPKLVGEATPMATPPESVATPAPRPRPTPAPVRPTAPMTRTEAAPTAEAEPSPAPAARPAGSPQRTIIVRAEGEADRQRTTPARPVTYPDTPDPTAPSVAAPTVQPKRIPPANVPDKPVARNQIGTAPPLPPMRRTDNAEPYQGRTAKHTVGAGQTFYSLAKYYGIPVADLLASNNLTTDDKLAVGQVLTVEKIPSGYPSGQPVSAAVAAPVIPAPTAPPVQETPPPTNVPEKPAFHTVAKGETLYRISKQYGVTVDDLVRWNKLSGTTVKEGQKLTLSE